ncbi:hypothetical protein [Saccharothrix stipae]
MSRYDWPPSSAGRIVDDAGGRAAYNVRRAVVLESSADRLSVASPPTGDQHVWVPVGPDTVIHGQADSGPRVSGRIRDLQVDDGGQRAYAAAAGGGVWYTEDGATTWRPLGNWAATTPQHPERSAAILSCGSIEVDFGDTAADDKVVVGTGELTSYPKGVPGGHLGGVGVLWSTGPAVRPEFDDPWTRELPELEGCGVYRIARTGPTYFLATTHGLYRGPLGALGPVTTGPFADRPVLTDVLHVVGPQRLFVASNTQQLWVSDDQGDSFTEVELPGHTAGRLGLAVSPDDPALVYVLGGGSALGGGPLLWRVEAKPGGFQGRPIGNVPANLFGEKDAGRRASYHLAIAAKPDDASVIVLGGGSAGAVMDAALVRCTVQDKGGALSLDWDPKHDVEDYAGIEQGRAPATGFALDPTWIGLGVHADVHAVRFVAGDDGHELWVACDGGVFRSRSTPTHQAGANGTFAALNTGLGVLETGYVAGHPFNDMSMVAGTQDNGTIVRIGDGVWELVAEGDGGGVAFHPDHPEVVVCQYTGADWRAEWFDAQRAQSRQWAVPVLREKQKGKSSDSEDKENNATLFYSGVAVVRSGTGATRVAIGTNRVWACLDFDPAISLPNTWVTLPNGLVDPRQGTEPDDVADVRYEGGSGHVVALRWETDTRLLVLMRGAVLRYRLDVSPPWEVDVLTDDQAKKYRPAVQEDIKPSMPYLPRPVGTEWSDIAVHDPDRGSGSCYVATTGSSDVAGMDTLWWHNGFEHWHRTGLREEGAPAPAYAVVVDPDDRGVVYVGTGTGVLRGELVQLPEGPDWSWQRMDVGLPSAAVQDLALHKHDGRKLLRAALQSRGVWEVDLSGDPGPKTYLKAVRYDSRRRPGPPGKTRFPRRERFDETTPWFTSPDIAVRPAPGEASAGPGGNPLATSRRADRRLWEFQAALHDVDPLCRPTGLWTPLFERRLIAFRKANPVNGKPVPAADQSLVDQAVWDQVVKGHEAKPMWDGVEPTEADLLELVRHHMQDNHVTRVFWEKLAVDVLVHHRDVRPLDPSAVRVMLLRRELAVGEAFGTLALDDAACAAVTTVLDGGPAAPVGPWTFADLAGEPVRQPSFPLSARAPRPVTFPVDAPGSGKQVLLLAVMTTDADPVALEPGLVSEKVDTDHHLAARMLTQ